MRDNGLQHRRRWRQLVSCIVAYVFALQIVLFGFAAPPFAAPAADQDVLTAGLCLHDGGAPLAPGNNSGADEHCKFCPTGGHAAFAAPATVPHAVVRAVEAVIAPAADQLAPRPRAHAAAQPRGPPPTA